MSELEKLQQHKKSEQTEPEPYSIQHAQGEKGELTRENGVECLSSDMERLKLGSDTYSDATQSTMTKMSASSSTAAVASSISTTNATTTATSTSNSCVGKMRSSCGIDWHMLDKRFTEYNLGRYYLIDETDSEDMRDRKDFWKNIIESSAHFLIENANEISNASSNAAAAAVAGQQFEPKLIISCSKLSKLFEIKDSKNVSYVPAGLDFVLNEMINESALLPLNTFEAENGSLFASAKTILKLAWQPIKSTFFPSKSSNDEKLVLINVARALGSSIYNHLQEETGLSSITDQVMCFPEFALKCQEHLHLSEADALIVLRQMQKDSLLVTSCSSDAKKEMVIKLLRKNSSEKLILSTSDMKLASIKSALFQVEKHYEHMEMKSQQLTKKAVENKIKNNIKEALHCLAKRKVVQKIMDTHMGSRFKLQQILLQIQQMEQQKMIYDSYVQGVDLLKTLRNSYGVTESAIDEVTLDIEDLIQEQDDIDRAMMQNNANNIDDPELEKELSRIIDDTTNAGDKRNEPDSDKANFALVKPLPSNELSSLQQTKPLAQGDKKIPSKPILLSE